MSLERFYPRCLVELRAVVGGREELVTGADGLVRTDMAGAEDIATIVVPSECSWTLNPHSRASTSEVTIETSALPFDSPDVHAIGLSVFAGLADSNSTRVLEDHKFRENNLRFLGFVDEPEMVFGKSSKVRLKARDLSCLGRDVPMPTSCTPRYSDTVIEAVQRIVNGVPGMKDHLTVASEAPDKSLSDLVGKKGRTSPVQLKHGISAWEAIETICGMAAMMASVYFDQLIIRFPGSGFGDPGNRDSNEPVFTFIWGQADGNTADVRFQKRFQRQRKGLVAYAYDAEHDQVLTSKYPPDDKLPARLRPAPSHPGRNADKVARSGLDSKAPPKHSKRAPDKNPPERDPLYVRHIHTQSELDNWLEGAWKMKGSQEVQGELSTPWWTPELLALRNGDRVLVKVRPDVEAELRRYAQQGDREGAVRFLRQRLLLSDDAARAMVSIAKRERFDQYLVGSVHHSFYAQNAPETRIQFFNLLRA